MGKHWNIAKEAYKREKELLENKLSVEQKDFLPAALEILEKPASPLGRFTIWTLCSFFLIALLWSIIGSIDVVAVSQGKVVPIVQSKVIQSLESGVVRSILVQNGTVVTEGQKLIELDSTSDGADTIRLKQERDSAQLILSRNQWLLGKLQGEDSTFVLPETFSDHDFYLQNLLAHSQHDEYLATQEAYAEQIIEKKTEAIVSSGEIEKLQETIPLLEEQVAGLKQLSEEGVAPRFKYLEYEETLLSRLKDLGIEKNRQNQISAGVRSLEKQKEQHLQEFRKLVISELAESSNQVATISQEVIKAEQAEGLRTLTSPVNGVVQQLTVNTLGGVVRAGDPLLVVVPSENILQAEAKILNKDIGFVRVGQDVEVKLEAFPFTKYGIIHGRVLSIDQDAVQDEDFGLIYPARISMQERSLLVNGEEIPLAAGMGLTAEVKTGKRQIVEFLLAPLFRYKSESLRER